MADNATQLSALPTRKAAIGIVLASLTPALMEIYAQVVPAFLSGPSVQALVGALLALAIIWWVPDAPNMPVVVPEDI